MLDYLGIFKGLNSRKINYIVVGGLAINLYGIPRMTYDIDLLIDFNEANIEKFSLLMNSWGFKPKAPVNILGLADPQKRLLWIRQKNMKAFNLVNPSWALSELDILIDTPVDYDTAKHTANKISIKGTSIPVISIDNLIKMKRVSGRKQDKLDIQNLKKQSHAK